MAEDKWSCKADKLKGTQTEKNLQQALICEYHTIKIRHISDDFKETDIDQYDQ